MLLVNNKYEYLLKEFRNYAGGVVINWHSKKILSWKLSNTIDVSLTITVLIVLTIWGGIALASPSFL